MNKNIIIGLLTLVGVLAIFGVVAYAITSTPTPAAAPSASAVSASVTEDVTIKTVTRLDGTKEEVREVKAREPDVDVKYPDGLVVQLGADAAYDLVMCDARITNKAEILANPRVRYWEAVRKAEGEKRIRDAGYKDQSYITTPMATAEVPAAPVINDEVVEQKWAFTTAPPADSPLVWRSGTEPELDKRLDGGVSTTYSTYSGPGKVLENGDVLFERDTKKTAKAERVMRAPVIPDDLGLGERLVLIDVLVDRFGQRRTDLIEWTMEDLVACYWAQVKLTRKPAPFPERAE